MSRITPLHTRSPAGKPATFFNTLEEQAYKPVPPLKTDMSGVEAASFVLAAFPLLISALEHYRGGAEVLQDWWSIKREYRKCKQNVSIQKLAFEENLEELLAPVVESDHQLKCLLADPGGTTWKDPTLEGELKERLPKSYGLYLGIIDEIRNIVEKLKGELGVSRVRFQDRIASNKAELTGDRLGAPLGKLTGMPNLEFQAQRIKFSFNKKVRNQLLDELARYNAQLRDLLASSDRLAESRGHWRNEKSAVGMLHRFWHHANSLYSILASTWRCNCQEFHNANLLLQHRTTPEIGFNILFLFGQSMVRPGPGPWTWQGTKILVVEKVLQQIVLGKLVSSDNSVGCAVPPGTNGPGEHLVRPAVKATAGTTDPPSAKRKGVTWAEPDSQIVPGESVSPSAHPENPHEVGAAEITNLCSTIASCSPSLSCLGFLKDKEHRYSVFPLLRPQTGSDARETVTLETLLSASSQIPLTRRQRYYIALTIASSHLQIHSTPWLGARWSKKDVVFLRDGPSIILADQPYISRNFTSDSASSLQAHEYGDRSISTLGIMLLELCFGIALEDHCIRKNFVSRDGQPNPALDLVAAMEWCRFAHEEAGPEFAEAIEWCLHKRPERGSADVKDNKWREELFVKVVKPLQCCYQQLTGGTKSQFNRWST